MAQKETIAKAPERRVRRTGLGTRNILSVAGKEPGYQYRFVNDVSDRIQSHFLDYGWEVVEQNDNLRIGDKRLGTPSALGSTATASVGQGVTGVLLRIKDEYYKEDQAEKQAYVNRTEDTMRENALDGTYGKLEISRD